MSYPLAVDTLFQSFKSRAVHSIVDSFFKRYSL